MILRDTNIRRALKHKQRGFLMNPHRFGVAGGDPDFASVTALFHADGADNDTTSTDSSLSARALTAFGNAKISTTQSKWGGSSFAFDGAGDYWTAAHDAGLNLGSGLFAIEMFVYLNSLTGYQAFVSKKATGQNFRAYQIYKSDAADNQKLYFTATANDTSWGIVLASAANALSVTTWHFIQVIRTTGNVWKLYVDAVEKASSTTALTIADTTNPLVLGISLTSNDAPMNGYIDDFRITKGVSRTAVVPSAAFPNF